MKERNVDIINNDVFRNSNLCYKNKLKETKANGKGETNHYPEIEPEDLKKLYSSFDLETPTGLFEKVWFDIMFQLVRRGRENLRTMTKSSFAIGEDGTGLRYIYQCKSELDKNHNIKDNAFDTTGEGRIYETKTTTCPVTSFLKYTSLLNPDLDCLWQRPNESTKSTKWYCNVPVGQKILGGMMPRLSEKYKLSQRYTNHSIRVTSLQVLEDANVEGRHIIRVSGHKSLESSKIMQENFQVRENEASLQFFQILLKIKK